MNLRALDTYCSKPFLGANTNSNHLHKVIRTLALWYLMLILSWKPPWRNPSSTEMKYLPSATLVSDVVLDGSTNLTLVKEGAIHELVQKTSL